LFDVVKNAEVVVAIDVEEVYLMGYQVSNNSLQGAGCVGINRC
jgi:hypothetical protein